MVLSREDADRIQRCLDNVEGCEQLFKPGGLKFMDGIRLGGIDDVEAWRCTWSAWCLVPLYPVKSSLHERRRRREKGCNINIV